MPLVATTLLLSGCLTSEFAYKPGITPAERNADLTQCRSRALAQFPVDKVTRRTPVQYVPARRICKKGGKDCRTIPGEFRGGDVIVTDINAQARTQGVSACLGARGYETVALPQCQGDDLTEVKTHLQGVYPPLASDSCAVRMKDGTIKVLTP